MGEMPSRRTHEFRCLHYVVFDFKRRDDLHGSPANIVVLIHYGFGFYLRLFCIGSECHWFVSFAFRAVHCLGHTAYCFSKFTRARPEAQMGFE
jgi:hypothetical protein